jgi:hypothetical protein
MHRVPELLTEEVTMSITSAAVLPVEPPPSREVGDHLLFVTTAHPSMHDHDDPNGQAIHRHLGRLIQPRHTSSIEKTEEAGIPWGADNDCFQGLDEKAFVRMLDRLQPIVGTTFDPETGVTTDRRAGRMCKFVTVPDVVGDAFETAKQFEKWAPALERRGLPVALVLQNGIDRPSMKRWLDRTWHRLDAVFIGGDDEFKLGPLAAELAREAKRRGLWVHWGRVNSRKRMKHCIATGACDSMDGSMWARFRKTHLDKGLRWLMELTGEFAAVAAQLVLDAPAANVVPLRSTTRDNCAIVAAVPESAEEVVMQQQEMERRESGEDGIRVETVIVTERNVAGQCVREVEVERTHEAGRERQTIVRAVGYRTDTSEAHGFRALPPEEARRYVAGCEERGLLTHEFLSAAGSASICAVCGRGREAGEHVSAPTQGEAA